MRNVTYDPFSTSLDSCKHFVVRYMKWTNSSTYPIGYVSQEIKPKSYEKYYSLQYGVPAEIYPYVTIVLKNLVYC